jgi:hypothetical protein
MLQLELELPGDVRTFRLVPGSGVLGRGRSCDLVVPHDSISRRHLQLQVGESEVLVTDLGSRNGLWCHGERVTRAVLRPGDTLVVGRLRATLVRVEVEHPRPAEEKYGATLDLLRDLVAGPAAPSRRPAAAPPTEPVLHRYVVRRAVEDFSAVEILEAWDSVEDRPVFLKAAPLGPSRHAGIPDAGSGPVVRLEHPSIADPLDAGTWQGKLHVVEQKFPGKTLADRLRRGALPGREALRISREVGSAIAHAHSRGVVHGNLRPACILLRREGPAVVLEFGLASVWRTAPVSRARRSVYAPPRAPGATADGAGGDVHAAAVVLHEMLTGEIPTRGPIAPERLGILAGTAGRDAATAVAGLLARVLRPPPGASPVDARAWCDEVGAILERMEAPVEPDEAPPSGRGALGRALRRLVR